MHTVRRQTITIGPAREPRFWLACLLLALIATGCSSGKQDAAKLEEVKAIWARLPIYSGLQETDSSTTSGGGKAMINKKYRSDASYTDVRRFYVDHLLRDGWAVVSEKQMKDWGSDFGGYYIQFQRDDLFLSIEYSGAGANYGWDYGIAVSWSRWVKKK